MSMTFRSLILLCHDLLSKRCPLHRSQDKKRLSEAFFMNAEIRAKELQQTLAAIRHETTMFCQEIAQLHALFERKHRLIETKPWPTTRAPNLHFQHMLGKH
ncbi:unnamed protein product [Caenorhabditis auriculariae]|uniref:Uncharacterized protein n=1 Tax=Caenorhabditis auriculariae TaxID=2777116 RepID=A0A8S1HRQ3_9PELO|nr:unnamed protein product [Caenorhabditis auriculariae]